MQLRIHKLQYHIDRLYSISETINCDEAGDLDGGGLLGVERVEKLLFVFVEGENGAQNQQLDAAAFQQLNLVVVRHCAKRCHLPSTALLMYVPLSINQSINF